MLGRNAYTSFKKQKCFNMTPSKKHTYRKLLIKIKHQKGVSKAVTKQLLGKLKYRMETGYKPWSLR